MREIKSLGDVKVDILPPKVIMLLSKYSYRLKKCSGKTIKLSSKAILYEVDEVNNQVDDEVLQSIYKALIAEFSSKSNVSVRKAIFSRAQNEKPIKDNILDILNEKIH